MSFFFPRMVGTLLGIGALAIAGGALAQDSYPDRPIRVVVPAAAGQVTDTIARLLVSKLQERTGWQMIVENRPGGNFSIGVNAAVQAPADGYTLLSLPGSVTILNNIRSDLGYDPATDLAMVAIDTAFDAIVFTHNSLPVDTFDEFIDYVRERPGEISYAVTGSGSFMHLAGVLLEQGTETDMIAVSYSGPTTDILDGRVPVKVGAYSEVITAVNDGTINPLLVLSNERSSFLPDVPSSAEIGNSAIVAQNFSGWAVKAGTPPEIVERLSEEIVAVLELPEVREQYLRAGAEPLVLDAAAAQARLEDDIEKWKTVIDEAQLSFE